MSKLLIERTERIAGEHFIYPPSSSSIPETDRHKADFSRADFSSSNLREADLSRADFSNANFFEADLSRANLHGTNFNGSNLNSANLNSADLSGANLTSVRGLTPEQVKKAVNWEKAYYDRHFRQQLGLAAESTLSTQSN